MLLYFDLRELLFEDFNDFYNASDETRDNGKIATPSRVSAGGRVLKERVGCFRPRDAAIAEVLGHCAWFQSIFPTPGAQITCPSSKHELLQEQKTPIGFQDGRLRSLEPKLLTSQK
jgi:hypothetical protein